MMNVEETQREEALKTKYVHTYCAEMDAMMIILLRVTILLDAVI